MQTMPVMPPPRPPRDGNIATGSYDWHDNPNMGRWAKLLFLGRMFAKLLVFGLLAIALSQMGLILFKIVRLQFFP